MHKPESFQENKTHKILRDFDKQTDHLMQTKRPDRMSMNKNNRICHRMDFAISVTYKVKIQES